MMFGGLDIKGSSSNNTDGGKPRDDAPPSNNASAFSFLSLNNTSINAPSAMTEHSTAVTSAFSFLNSASTTESSTTTTSAPIPAMPTMSAFSFLQPTPSSDDNDTGVSAASATSTSSVDAAANPLSSFSFLTSSAVTTPPAPVASHDDAPSGLSAFSFLSTTPQTVEHAPAPASATTSFGSDLLSAISPTAPSPTPEIPVDVGPPTTTATSTASSSSSHWDDHLSMTNPTIPAGSGIVFGGAVTMEATSKKPIKKRTRVQRVGVGATSVPPSPPKPAPAAATTSSSSNQSMSQATREDHNDATDAAANSRASHREAAEEASWRAEQFLRDKMMEKTAQNAAALEQQQQQQQQSTNNAVELTRTKSGSSYRSDQQLDDDLDDEDDVVAAAKAAAEEARYLSSSSSSASARHRIFGDRLGGLFQRKPWGNNSSHPPSQPQHTGAPSLFPAATSNSWLSGSKSLSETSSGELTAVERIQREQEEIKRAMAERQWAMQQHQLQHQQQYPPKPGTDEFVEQTAQTEPREFVPPQLEPPLVQQTPVPQPPPPPPPPPAPVPKTPDDLFDEMMTDFHANVQKAMDRVGQLRQQRAMLLEERFVTLAKERLASQQMAQAEAQQAAAAEAEDFDLADQMGTVLEKHSRERAELDSILESIGRALEQLETQRVQVVGAVGECFVDVRNKLKKFEKEQQTRESKGDTDAMKKFSAVAKQLSAENERLQQDLKHLERDETLVAEERKELETAISEHSGEHEVQRDEAALKLQHVEDEIEELRKCLAAKEAVAEELRADIRSQDEAIGKIRVKFSRQLLRVQTKEATLKENRQEWENEKSTYERQKDVHETEVREHSQSLLTHDELMTRLKSEISLASTFERIVSKEVGFEGLLKDNEETDGDLAQMHSEVVKCEAAVSKAMEVLKAANSTLKALEEEHKTLIARIPDLESEKKAAAARRDFKTAGKASKEIKDATIRLKECEQELTCEAAERKKAAEEELKKLEIELEETRKTTQEKEKISGDATMLTLAQKIKDLIATKKSICGNASGASIQGIGAFVLNGQIDCLKMEGQTLGSKYGGWDELLAEIDAIENAEVPEVDAVTAKEAAKDYGDFETETTTSSDSGGEAEMADADQQAQQEEAPPVSRQDRIDKFKHLTSQLKEAEESLEAAVAREDYEDAAELEDVFQGLQKELEALDLTDEEMEVALGGEVTEKANETTAVESEPSDEVTEDKDDDNTDDTAKEKEPTTEQSEPEPSVKDDDEPVKDDDEQVNDDTEASPKDTEENGVLDDDVKNDGEKDSLQSTDEAVVADTNGITPSIQESDIGTQAEA